MRILVIYHMGVAESSRPLFEALASLPSVDLHVVVPRCIETQGWRHYVFQGHEDNRYAMSSGRLLFPEAYTESIFVTGLVSSMCRFKPQIIQVLDEAASYITCQSVVYRDWFLPRAKLAFYSFENVALNWQGKLGLIRRAAERHVLQRADRGICTSEGACEVLTAKGFDSHKIRKVYWGVNTDQFRPEDKTAVRARLGIQPAFTVGYVGRLTVEKGLLTLVQAVASLPRVQLLIVGDGPQKVELFQEAGRLGLMERVMWIGEVHHSQIAHYLNAMDVLVLPSRTMLYWREQFGRVLVEAMACEVPVVGSSSGAIPEIVGNCGLIFQEDDAIDLSQKLSILSQDPTLTRTLGLCGRERVVRDFSWETFAHRMLAVYEEMSDQSL